MNSKNALATLLAGLLTLKASTAEAGIDTFNCSNGLHAQTDRQVGFEFWVHLSFPIASDDYEVLRQASTDSYADFDAVMSMLWNDEHIDYIDVYSRDQIELLRSMVNGGYAVPMPDGRLDLAYNLHISHPYSWAELHRFARVSFDYFDAKMAVVVEWAQLRESARRACHLAALLESRDIIE